MNKYLIMLTIFTSLVLFSCTIPNGNEPIEKLCGFEMTMNEVNDITRWSEKNPDVYDIKNGYEIYSEINDSIRINMPDTLVFEIFLSKLTQKEVCIDVYVSPNEKYFKRISCTLMNSKFSNMIPSQRKIRIYSYTNPDGSGDSPFEVAVKSNK